MEQFLIFEDTAEFVVLSTEAIFIYCRILNSLFYKGSVN